MSEKDILHIAVSCNERYVPGALVALAGVAVYAKPDTPISFHVFTEGVKTESIDFMRSTLKRLHAKCEFHQHICEESLLEGLPYWAGSRMAAVRCYYATLMPDVDWCLYLDCDILYLASVDEHFSYCDENVYACVVQEEAMTTRCSERAWIRDNCGIEISDDQYFNSGVVLFNFKKMREDGIPERLVEFFRKYPQVPSPDQDALNATFGGKIKMIPKKFDRLQIFLTDEKLAERPVVHYVCGNPWLPKYGEVASWRFRLWHRFVDKNIFKKQGDSFRWLFTKKILLIKYISYYLLRMPIVWRVYVHVLAWCGLIIHPVRWRWQQVEHDCSSIGVDLVLNG